MSAWHGGKGSSRRGSANDKQFVEGWDRIFGQSKNLQSDTTQHTGGVRRKEKKEKK